MVLRFLRYLMPIIYLLPILGSMGCEPMILFDLINDLFLAFISSPQGQEFACEGFRA
jgi:hypothetical protein